MEVTVQKKEKNPLFNRVEVSVTIHHEKKATPSRSEVLERVTKIVEADPKLCTVRELRTAYGSNYSTALVHVYTDEKSLKEFEPAHLIDRTLKSLGLKQGAKPKPKSEKPAQQKPEEKIEEKKPEKEEKKESVKGDETGKS